MSKHGNKNNNEKAEGKEELKPETAKQQEDVQVTVSQKEYDALKVKATERDSYYNDYLRAHADFENTKKRLEKEKAEFLRYANESLVLEFLPIADNLEIAEKHIKEAKDFKAVQDGVDMIQKQIQLFLKDVGVERIKTVGEKFDPHLHDVLEVEESNDKEDGLIVAELKPGYKFNSRLIRPASVKIIKKKSEENKSLN